MSFLRHNSSCGFVPAFAFAMLSSAANEQSATLVPASAAANDWFGSSVDLQGELCIAGAPYHSSGGVPHSGSAFVFERVGQTWTERAELQASDAQSQDDFGCVVALDGDTALVGADWEGEGLRHYGAAYVFVRTGAQWTQQAKLVAPLRLHNARFGRTLAISGDTAVIGAAQYSWVSSFAGAADVFVRSGTSWNHQAHLEVTDTTYQAAFGADIALEGDTLLIAAARDNAGALESGSVYVFGRSGSTWTKQAKLNPLVPETLLRFGASLDLEGDRAVIGTYALPGSVYVFERNGGVWLENALLQPMHPLTTALFGYSVALNGERIAVGALLESEQSVYAAGAAHLFDHNGSAWTETMRLVSPTPADSDQFSVVALDGPTLAVGEFKDGANNSGAVHIYEFGGFTTYCTAGTTTHGCTPHMWLNGATSLSGTSPAWLTTTGVESNTSGLIFVGARATATPWAPPNSSLLCVMQPLARLPPELDSGGAPDLCNGTIKADVLGYVHSHGGTLLGQPVVAGMTFRAQAWFRDQFAPHHGNLSDALAFTFDP